MDEAIIAAKLADNVPKEQPVVPQPAVAIDPADVGYADELPFDEITRYKLLERFNVPQNYWSDPEINSQIVFIYQWASDLSQSTDYLEVSAYIRRIESMLGGMGADVRKLYRHAKLDTQRRNIEEQIYANYGQS